MRVRQCSRYVLCAVLCAAALALVTPAAGAEAVESYAVGIDGNVFLIDRDGDVLVEQGVFRHIYQLYDSYDTNGKPIPFYAGMPAYGSAAFDKSNPLQGYALIDIVGNPITAYEYSSIEYAGGGRFYVTQSEKMGVIDAEGRVIVPVEYADIISSGDGGFLAVRESAYSGNPQGLYYLDENGAESVTGVKVAAYNRPYGPYSTELIPAMDPTDKWGYLDSRGHWAIEPQYNWCDAFNNGYAIAAVDSGVGIINAQGNWVVTPKYNYIGSGYDIIGAPFIAGLDGNMIKALSADDFSVIAELKGDAWSNGYSFGDDLLAMISDKGAYMYDFKGNLLFSLSADECGSCWYIGGYIMAYDKNYYTSLYSRDGTRVSGPFQSVAYIDGTDGLFIFNKYREKKVQYGTGENEYYYTAIPSTYRAGIMDHMGNEIVKPKYDRIYQVGSDRLIAESPDYLTLIDTRGTVIRQFAVYTGLMD